MEQNQELKNKPKHIRSNNIWQGTQEYLKEKKPRPITFAFFNVGKDFLDKAPKAQIKDNMVSQPLSTENHCSRV